MDKENYEFRLFRIAISSAVLLLAVATGSCYYNEFAARNACIALGGVPTSFGANWCCIGLLNVQITQKEIPSKEIK